MCFGGGGPKIEKQAPANSGASLGMYQQQMRDQQSQLTAQLQEQINASNSRVEELQAQLQAEQEALAADLAQQFEGAYNTTQQSKPAEGAQTTKKIEPVKDKSRDTLKINVAGLSNTSGTGLNLGV